MLRLGTLIAHLRDDQRGQSTVENAMVAGLVSIAVIALLTLLGTQIGAIFNQISSTLNQVPGVPY